jgi:hypothetical protein
MRTLCELLFGNYPNSTKFDLAGVDGFFDFALDPEMVSRGSLGVELTLTQIAFLA